MNIVLIKIIIFFKKNIIILLLFLIKIYQKILSPWLGTNCYYTPSCSEYTAISLKSHGIFNGIYMGIQQILQCHPWSKKVYNIISDKKKI